MATTSVGAAMAAVVVTVAAVGADVVTGSATLVGTAVVPISLRAAAIAIHDSGDSTGAVGEVPANGLSSALTAWEIAVVNVSAGAAACGFGVTTVTSDAAGVRSTAAATVGVLTVGAVASFGALAACAVDSRTAPVEAAAPDLSFWASVVAAVLRSSDEVFSTGSRTVLLEGAEASDFFFFDLGPAVPDSLASAVLVVPVVVTADSLEPVAVLGVWAAVCFSSDVDVPAVEVLLGD
jgi:hypothetical protein